MGPLAFILYRSCSKLPKAASPVTCRWDDPVFVMMLIVPPNVFFPKIALGPGIISIRSIISNGIKSKLTVLKFGSLTRMPSRKTLTEHRLSTGLRGLSFMRVGSRSGQRLRSETQPCSNQAPQFGCRRHGSDAEPLLGAIFAVPALS